MMISRRRSSILSGSLNIPQDEDACNRDEDCQNDGICSLASRFTELNVCSCMDDYVGTHCEDYCPLQCGNHGACRTKEDSHACVCHGQWTGDSCEIPYLTCDDSTVCLHGGTCVALVLESSSTNTTYAAADAAYGCNCPPGFDAEPTCKPNLLQLSLLDPFVIFCITGGTLTALFFLVMACKSYCARREHLMKKPRIKSITDGSFNLKRHSMMSMREIQDLGYNIEMI